MIDPRLLDAQYLFSDGGDFVRISSPGHQRKMVNPMDAQYVFSDVKSPSQDSNYRRVVSEPACDKNGECPILDINERGSIVDPAGATAESSPLAQLCSSN
jgi:hypothetical protein